MNNAPTREDVAAESGTNLDSVKRRVAKLMAIASDDRANPAEAASAAAMAERLMRKFQIDNVELVTSQLKSGAAEFFSEEFVGTTLDPEGYSKTKCAWSGILAVAVAELHDCQARFSWSTKHGKSLKFSGYAEDAQMARFTYVYLVQSMALASRQYLAAFQHDGRRGAENFRRGFNAALVASLNEASASKKREMQVESDSRALVVVKEDAVAKQFGVVKYSHRSENTRFDRAFHSGVTEGRKVDVTRRGLSTGSSNLQLGA
jgi:hypothetical protein